MNARDMLKLANDLKRLALARARGHVGVTIIVHATDPADDVAIAVASTLPSRAHQRALMAEVLAQSVLADGATFEEVAELVTRDHALHVLGKRES